ncbi:MAG: hypothetical protein HKP48_09780 [Winogradskyella sp.]|uniref:hypothetical protein n=1 Tax=Winogradskyella sp. TaxID=1883156 RepID=UPI0017D4B7C6|nr:hypothetical protein [Winogradskyella sp.]MBT8245636.1 hypothetical protein [Winogradskyella sp.]NNK23556.1 hypothetical protein [Winogradskyella sp.]
MPKPHTFPTLYNEALQISITKLKEWDYLSPEQIKSGTLTWSRNGNETGSISIKVNTHSEQPYIELDYKYRDELRNYKVSLVSMPSNLGKGLIWYFLCPQTKKRCRKLYSIGGYFLHREAFNGCMYETQTQSKKYRQLDKTLGAYFKTDDLYSQLYQKHFKKTYAGKPTKKYLRIMEQIHKAESIPYQEIEREMLS